jgi:hypothetical protein
MWSRMVRRGEDSILTGEAENGRVSKVVRVRECGEGVLSGERRSMPKRGRAGAGAGTGDVCGRR